jgi:hypothetical protein
MQNIARHLGNAFDASGSDCRTFAEILYMKQRGLDAALLPDVMVLCGDLEPGATATDARHDQRAWLGPEPVEGLDAVVDLPGLEPQLPIAEIYGDVIA